MSSGNSERRPLTSWAVRVLLSLSLGLVTCALVKILAVQKSWKGEEESTGRGRQRARARDVLASAELRWSPVLHPSRIREERTAVLIAYKQTTKAANALLRENFWRRRALDGGQRWLLWAGLCVGLAVAWYMYGVRPPSPGG